MSKVSKEVENAREWFIENRGKIEGLGDSGVELAHALTMIFQNKATQSALNLTGYKDIDEILLQADKVEKAMEDNDIDLEKILEVVATGFKFALTASAILGV